MLLNSFLKVSEAAGIFGPVDGQTWVEHKVESQVPPHWLGIDDKSSSGASGTWIYKLFIVLLGS